MKEAQRLLERKAPEAKDAPALIEQLNIAAFDTASTIADLKDRAAEREALACDEASNETNETKRKSRKAEILRDDSTYIELKTRIRAEERIHFRLTERAHRLAREFRLTVAEVSAGV